MEYSTIFGVVGFVLAAYAVIANDSAQTLGTFIASNRKTKWYWKWLLMSVVMVGTLTYSYYVNNDVSHGRLNEIPLPTTFAWYHLAAPGLLVILTRFGIPASTTILTLSVFANSAVLEKILLKSAVGYCLAAVVAYFLWIGVSQFLNERKSVSKKHKQRWRIAQWIATCFLWQQWLAHDIANIAVYLPRGAEMPVWMFISFMIVLVIGLAQLFRSNGGKIQEIVLSKSGTRFMRSATIIDFVFALILLYFKMYNDVPMSTTWVFVGLLCGRELAVYKQFKPDKGVKVIFPMLVNDFLKMIVGLTLSVLLVWLIS
jgi:phosphate/sulfate permease